MRILKYVSTVAFAATIMAALLGAQNATTESPRPGPGAAERRVPR